MSRALTHPSIVESYPERGNLYRLTLDPMPTELYLAREVVKGKFLEKKTFISISGSTSIVPSTHNICITLQNTILEALQHAGYPPVKKKFALVADTNTNYAPEKKSLRIYPAFQSRVLCFNDCYWLCLDHQLIVRSVMSLDFLERLNATFSLDSLQRVIFRNQDGWDEGKWIRADFGGCYLSLLTGEEVKIAKQDIVPHLTRTQIIQVAPLIGVRAQDLERTIKQLSFLTISNAPRARLDACTEFAERISQQIFPLKVGNTAIHLNPSPATLRPPHFVLNKNFEEVAVSFDHIDSSKRAQNILAGLTSFGAYGKATAQLKLVLISTTARATLMERLVDRLNNGSYRYQGAQRTFGSKFIIQDHLICTNISEYEEKIRGFVRSNVREETDIALVYLPKVGNISSPGHSYFRVKGKLVQEGLASQMIDETTVQNPDWRDLNLALKIYAKAGNIPWVLDEAIPGVDLFIGLSSSQPLYGSRKDRTMGYVNVFDSYGRWQFYQGDGIAFPFNERLDHYGELVKNSIAAYRIENRGSLGSVHIHLTKAFSRSERAVLADAVRSIIPDATIVFVWINPHHNLRLYDLSESSGKVSRATYLYSDPSRCYLATTGSNIFGQRGMGTPVPLELTVWADPIDAIPPHEDLCQQMLSLTRLNWASSNNFCQEPITTKFAGDIARRMAAFMTDPNFVVNPHLRGTPWFL